MKFEVNAKIELVVLKLIGENLIVDWAEFSTLSQAIFEMIGNGWLR